jgi:hypothetical protein
MLHGLDHPIAADAADRLAEVDAELGLESGTERVAH